MSSNYLLAIDCGTQSVRALVFDLGGHLVDKAQVALDSYATPEPGWVESDPEDFWRALCQACQHLWANTSVPKSAIRGVVVTTQRATVVNLDVQGRPLRPAIVWLDQRRSDADPKLAPWWEIALRAVNMRDTIRYFAREAEANWIAQHQPELWARTDKYLLLSGYLNWRFSGRFPSINGQVQPVLKGAVAGRFERWRLISSTTGEGVRMSFYRLAADAPDLRTVPAADQQAWRERYCQGEPLPMWHISSDGLTRPQMR